MLRSRLAVLLLVVPAACSRTAEPELPSDFAALVPPNAFALVVVRSSHELGQRVEEFRARYAPNEPALDDEDLLHRILSPLPRGQVRVDGSRPIGIAYRFEPESLRPLEVLILPVQDAAAFVDAPRSAEFQAPACSGSYVGFARGDVPYSAPFARETPSRLLDGAALGLLTARVDLAAVIEKYRPLIDSGLQRFEEARDSQVERGGPAADTAEVIDLYLQTARDFLDSAERFEAGADVREGMLELDCALESREGSPLAASSRKGDPDYRTLAARLDPEAALRIVAARGSSAVLQRFESMYERAFEGLARGGRASPEFLAGFQALLKRWKDLEPKLGPAYAQSIDLGAEGLRAAFVYRTPDPSGLQKAILELLLDPALAALGIVVTPSHPVELAGVEGVGVEARLDLRKLAGAIRTQPPPELDGEEAAFALRLASSMFGKDGARIACFSGGRRLGVVVGGDDAWRAATAKRIDSGGELAPELERGLARIHGQAPASLIQVDVGRVVTGLAGWLTLVGAPPHDWRSIADLAQCLGEAPLPASLHYGAAETTWSAGASIEFDGLLRLAQALRESEQLRQKR